MEQNSSGKEAGDQFSGVAVSVEEAGDGLSDFLQLHSVLTDKSCRQVRYHFSLAFHIAWTKHLNS